MSRADWIMTGIGGLSFCVIVTLAVLSVIAGREEARYSDACAARGGVAVARAHSDHQAVCLRAVDTIQVQR